MNNQELQAESFMQGMPSPTIEEAAFIDKLVGTLFLPIKENYNQEIPKPFFVLKVLQVVKHNVKSTPILTLRCLSESRIVKRTVYLNSLMDEKAFDQRTLRE